MKSKIVKMIKEKWEKLSFSILMLMLPVLSFAGTDILSGSKAADQVQGTFGPGSTVLSILLVVEVLYATFKYIKTRNLADLGGIVVVIIFTTVAFGLAIS